MSETAPPYPPLDDDQLAVVRWWISAPDDTTVGEARARFAAVGLTQSKVQAAFGTLCKPEPVASLSAPTAQSAATDAGRAADPNGPYPSSAIPSDSE